ncbi:MAG: hypothetical protein AAJB65_00725 [Candidatus Hodgkinia cicadicola]
MSTATDFRKYAMLALDIASVAISKSGLHFIIFTTLSVSSMHAAKFIKSQLAFAPSLENITLMVMFDFSRLITSQWKKGVISISTCNITSISWYVNNRLASL